MKKIITDSPNHIQLLENWEAGNFIDSQTITYLGIENCFASQEIDDALFKRINNISFKANDLISIADLRYLKILHKNIDGKICIGEMICNKSISADLLDIFKILYDHSYPIERMVLIDNYNADDNSSMEANNSSAFNFRFISHTKRLSKHSWGLAVDINPLYNPYVRKVDGKLLIDPSGANNYVNREIYKPYMILKDDLCYREFIKRGFKWGGEWESLKDYQHFDKTL